MSINIKPVFKNQALIRKGSFINGNWENKSESNEYFNVYDPATNEIIAILPDQSLTKLDEAIEIASKTFDTYRKISPYKRAQWLINIYNLMIENSDDLAKIITWENGKSLSDSKGEIIYAASFFKWFAGESTRLYGAYIQPTQETNRVITMKQPIGVCALICPWNFPSAMITRKIAAVLATGCTCILKPDHETPLSALALAYLIQKAGFPDGAVNVVLTKKRVKDFGLRMCQSKKIKKLSFTGSTSIGKLLMKNSSSSLKKLSLELGGNAPFIVFDDADLGKATDQLIACKFRGLGQTCVCANRIYVHSKIIDQFTELLSSKVQKFVLGHGLDRSTTHGCLINQKTLQKVERHKHDAIEKGARVVLNGGPVPKLGPNFYSPCILSYVTPDTLVAKEETFGPLCPIFEFNTTEEVIKFANDTEFGLSSYVFSRNIKTIFTVSEQLEAGIVSCNTGIFSDSAVPFGGVKESGFGREGSLYGIDDYTIVKSVVLGDLSG